MFIASNINRLTRRLLLATSLLLVLGFQAIESSHLHAGGLDVPDCVQCQLDTAQALTGSSAALDRLWNKTPQLSSAPEAVIASASYAPLPRGPPSLSS